MNYLENESRLKRSTALLTMLFVICVACVVLLINLILHAIIALFMMLSDTGGINESSINIWHLHAYLTAILLTYMFVFYLVRMNYLCSGGAVIAKDCGATELPDDQDDYYSIRLRNVIEEIAISMGVAVPRIFILKNDERINAFVAGYSQYDAAITVTKGALEKLNRDELQGVIAHEFSHILHYDMRLNIQLLAFSSGINAISESTWLLDMENHSDSKSILLYPLAFMAFLLIPVGCVGSMFTHLLKLGVNRKREYLADATAVRYTRLSEGIVGALKKIGGLSDVATKNASETGRVSHMMFYDSSIFSAMFTTHPSIVQRIKAIDPNFSEEELKKLCQQFALKPPNGMEEDRLLGFSDELHDDAVIETDQQGHTSEVPVFLAAHGAISQIPPLLRRTAHHYHAAIPVLYALLLSTNDNIREKQILVINAQYEESVILAVHAFFGEIVKMNPALRLPLASISFPALVKHPHEELIKFSEVVNGLIHADHNVSLYKYCLGSMLKAQVKDAMNPSRAAKPGVIKLADAAAEVSCLLAVMAQVGAHQVDAAASAYREGLNKLFPGVSIDYQPSSAFADALDPVWPTLDNLDPAGKQVLIEAMNIVMMHDGQITMGEAELIRTVSSILHCPLPMNML